MKKTLPFALFTFTIIVILITVSISNVARELPAYVYEVRYRLLLLNVAFIALISILILTFHSIAKGSHSRKFPYTAIVYIMITYLASVKIITLFSNVYLINPFDTTGLRGFIEDLILNGKVPNEGFYVEYAGAYDKLPIGPILTAVMGLLIQGDGVLISTEALDMLLKLTELTLTLFNALLGYAYIRYFYQRWLVLEQAAHRVNIIGISFITTFLILTSLLFNTSSLTLQYYAWPYLLLLHFIFIKSIDKLDRSVLILYIITLLALLNAHSTTNLFNSIYFLLILISVLIYGKQESKALTYLPLLSIMGFVVKLLYDAIRYAYTFSEVAKSLFVEVLRLLWGYERTYSSELMSLEYVGGSLTVMDYVKLFLVMLTGVLIITFLYMLMFTHGFHLLKARRTASLKANSKIILFSNATLVAISAILSGLILITGGHLYTALGHVGITFIATIPLLCISIIKSHKHIVAVILLLIFVHILFSGNALLVPKIGEEPLIALSNPNTNYKITMIEFLERYLLSCIRSSPLIASDIVTGWQIMGYAPRLFDCYNWKSPITEGLDKSVEIVMFPTTFRAGYLNEPLPYRLNAAKVIPALIAESSLIYNNNATVILVKTTS